MSAVPPAAVPLSGLARIALADDRLRRIGELAGSAEQEIVAPPAARPFVAAALAEKSPLLVVTATGREADDLTAELTEMLGEGVTQFRGRPCRTSACRRAPTRSAVACTSCVASPVPTIATSGPNCGSSSPPCGRWCSRWLPGSARSTPSRCGSAPNTTSRNSSSDSSNSRTPASTWSASAVSSRCAVASSTSSRPPPTIRSASSSGATRSPNCAASPSPTSVRSPKSTCRCSSHRRAANCCSPTRSRPAPRSSPRTTRPTRRSSRCSTRWPAAFPSRAWSVASGAAAR